MTTASISELRKAHTRTRSAIGQGGRTVRQGTGRSWVRRGRSAFGPRSSAAAGAVGCRSGDDGGGEGTPDRRQLATTATALGRCRRSQPRSTVGVVVGGVPAGHGPGRWGFGGGHRGWEGIAGGGDRLLRTWTAPVASGPARRLTMPATRPWIPADCRVGDEPGRCDDATG